MSAKKQCFMNQERPCDLTCKAAFEVDDPVDNVDCYFIWLTYHFGESVFELKRVLEGIGDPSGMDPGGMPGPGFPPFGGGPKGPPDISKN
ncbi:MAG: hypothetical protein ACI8TQ_001081 [Planctomycetota bacterium]|jgi:hypothetical protein